MHWRAAALLLCVGQLASGAGETRQLFNGRDLDGWSVVGAPPVFVVEDGELRTRGGAGLLRYDREKLGNVVLRVVYRMSAPEGNSGIFVRIPVPPESEAVAAHRGIEVQIDDRDDDWHCTGTLYSMTRAKARPAKPAGEWNVLEITLDSLRTKVTLNGVLVTDYDGVSPVPPRAAASEPERGPRPESGYIALQHHDNRAVISFREISAKALR